MRAPQEKSHSTQMLNIASINHQSAFSPPRIHPQLTFRTLVQKLLPDWCAGGRRSV